MTVLILTVGGSHQPILRSIGQNRPDRIVFLCSGDGEKVKGSYLQVDGEGKVCKSSPTVPAPDLPSISVQANLRRESYEVRIIDDCDDLSASYLVAIETIDAVHASLPDAKIIADYTGGTKSMTAGLAAAALDDGLCEIVVVGGQRTDLRQVLDQTESVRPAPVRDAQVTRRLRQVDGLLSRFDYAGATLILEDICRRFASPLTTPALNRAITLCRAFDAWDKFDHAGARVLLDAVPDVYPDHKRALAQIVRSKGPAWELVDDLLDNAHRRATQLRFDDALARLYRALELAAQIRLESAHGIRTGDVDPAKLPEQARTKLPAANLRGRIAMGLAAAWEVLAHIPAEPLGALYSGEKTQLLSALDIRNQSILAHGVRPVTAIEYRDHGARIRSFLERTREAAAPAGFRAPQLPVSFVP